MIRPLRRLHRRAFVLIGAAVPALLLAGLFGRAPQPTGALLEAAQLPATLQFESDTLWRSAEITTRIFSDGDAEPRFFVELEARSLPTTPDLLLYWSTEVSTGTLPKSATLLGPYSGGVAPFAIPAGEDPRAGMLVLYSLAHRTVLATAEAPNNER